MSRHKPQLVVHLQNAIRIRHNHMLVGAFDILHLVAAKDHRQTTVYRLRLEPSINDGLVGLCMAHDAGENEQCILPFSLVDPFAILVQNASVVGIHEGVGSALKLVVDA